MKFQWDKNKSQSNRQKHGISFEEAQGLWNDPLRVEVQTSFPDESRWILIAKFDEKLWTAIFTIRNQSIRIISVRRARKKEVLLYDEE